MRLSDLVPLARSLADQLTCLAAQNAAAEGLTVPCHKGCAECCEHLIPLSVPEAFRLWEELRSLDSTRRERVLGSFMVSARRLLMTPPPDLAHSTPSASNAQRPAVAETISRWYSRLQMSCPFLSDRICTSYENRPLACREHMAVSPVRSQRGCEFGKNQVLPLPLSVLEVTALLAAEMEGTELQGVILPLVPPWFQTNAERATRTWAAKLLVGRFVELLHELPARKSPEDLLCSHAA